MEIQYLKLKKKELINLSIISLFLSFLFSISFIRFSNENINFISTLISFIFFIFFLLGSRQIFMKLIGYKNAFEIDLRLTYFNRFWLNKWDKLTYWEEKVEKMTAGKKKTSFKGIPVYVISLFIYFLTLGLFIFPSIFSYSIKKIPHRFIGTQQKFEYQMGHMFNQDISGYRYSKALFGGFVYYFIIALLLKVFFSNTSFIYYEAFLIIIFWIAFVTIIPILGTEGYELWSRNNFAWISALTILITAMIALLTFESMSYTFGATIIISILVLLVVLWKQLLKE